MNFKPCCIDEIKQPKRQSANAAFIESFRASGENCAEITDIDASVPATYAALNATCRRIGGVRCVSRQGKLYLVRTPLEQQES